MELLERLETRSARIVVVGLGYVGLPLATALARAGFLVSGLDVDEGKVACLRAGESYISDVPSGELAALVETGRLSASTDPELLSQADAIVVCVPTPFTPTKTPDLSYVLTATEAIAARLRPGQLVVLQSTTYPGTTEEEVLPRLEATGLRAGQDFFLAFSPERINPGDKINTVENTPKVVGGVTPRCVEAAQALLRALTPQVYPVSSPRAAEMTKLLENVFRTVNIALVNELAKLAERMRIDLWEVIAAASTKPFGFMPFYPGAGVGGHCIPVDPVYLSWKAREYDFATRFIELAAETNQSMPYHAVERLTQALNRAGRSLKGAQILIMGVSFKRDIDDARNSPAERVLQLLHQAQATFTYHDPYVPHFSVQPDAAFPTALHLRSIPLTDEGLAGADAVLIVTGHTVVDYQQVVDRASLVVDCCNATAGARYPQGRVLRLGDGTA